jgi:hypothetical protein
MKSSALITLLLLSFELVTFGSLAQNYKHIEANGEIKNEKGVTVSSVTKNQIIMNHTGQKIAFVDNQGNLVDAKTGKKLGRMGKDGKNYYNADGEIEYTIKENKTTCDVYDAKGNKIGNVHSSLKGSACALACFENNHRKKAK